MSKIALLIGINYDGDEKLNGCVNDVEDIREFLEKNHFDYIKVLKEPSRRKIIKTIEKITRNLLPGDLLFFHYSGHGSYLRDYSSESYDETIVPADLEDIRDDELRILLADSLPEDAEMFAILDCCHSGTAMDLRYRYEKRKSGRYRLRKHNHDRTENHVVTISGCRDDQTSTDDLINGRYNGALTHAFLKSYKAGISYRELVDTIYENLTEYEQRPQICSGLPLDLDQAINLGDQEASRSYSDSYSS